MQSSFHQEREALLAQLETLQTAQKPEQQDFEVQVTDDSRVEEAREEMQRMQERHQAEMEEVRRGKEGQDQEVECMIISTEEHQMQVSELKETLARLTEEHTSEMEREKS